MGAKGHQSISRYPALAAVVSTRVEWGSRAATRQITRDFISRIRALVVEPLERVVLVRLATATKLPASPTLQFRVSVGAGVAAARPVTLAEPAVLAVLMAVAVAVADQVSTVAIPALAVWAVQASASSKRGE
jgi:hypothetical protein